MSYLEKNKEYWEKGYQAVHVDHPVFRFYGRILKPDFGLVGDGEKLVDFGCGQGAAVNFFHTQGFKAIGVDMSESDIAVAKTRYPHISDKFVVCQPNPADNPFYGYEDDVSVVTAIQALYYFADDDFEICMKTLYDSMRSGGVFFATMMGEKSREFFENSEEYEGGLRAVNFTNDRLNVKNYYISFIKNEEHLKKKFHMFTPVHIGYYAAKFRNDEGDAFHYTFCGVKP